MIARLAIAVFIVIVVIAVIAVTPAVPVDNVYVYVSDRPGQCFLDTYTWDGQVIGVYASSGDYADVTGVRFRVECERFGPEQVRSVTAPANMAIVEGDIFAGITVVFPSQALDHEPVLFIELSGHQSYGDAWTHDVSIMRASSWESASDFATFGYPFDCFSTAVVWFPPDTVEVVVDKHEVFSFKALVVQGGYPPNGMVSAVDASGWIPDPVEQWVWAGCGHCPWDFTFVTVPVHVPKGIADGTLNAVTFQMLSFGNVVAEKVIVLHARNSTSIEESTWGRVKVLYQ